MDADSRMLRASGSLYRTFRFGNLRPVLLEPFWSSAIRKCRARHTTTSCQPQCWARTVRRIAEQLVTSVLTARAERVRSSGVFAPDGEGRPRQQPRSDGYRAARGRVFDMLEGPRCTTSAPDRRRAQAWATTARQPFGGYTGDRKVSIGVELRALVLASNLVRD